MVSNNDILKRYNSLKNAHLDEPIIVCGCGTSTTQILEYVGRVTTVGVNDIGRLFTPDYLVVVNDKKSFKPDRWPHIENSQAKCIFTHFKEDKMLPIRNRDAIVKIQLGKYGSTDLNKPQVDYTSNSPYIGCIIAHHLGAKRIGLIGVDFTPNHFFANTGTHPLNNRLNNIITEYQRLHEALVRNGVEFYNLSSASKIEIPKMHIADFIGK